MPTIGYKTKPISEDKMREKQLDDEESQAFASVTYWNLQQKSEEFIKHKPYVEFSVLVRQNSEFEIHLGA